jgi:hypothetical protein
MTDRIVTVEEVAQILGDVPPDDANLTRLVDAVCAEASRYCHPLGRNFFYAVDRVDVVRGWGQDRVFLPNAPIMTLTEVRVDSSREFGDSTIIPISQFVIHAGYEDPRIWWPGYCFPDGVGTVQVKWTGGYYPGGDVDPAHLPHMPEDLRGVLIDEIVARCKRGPGEVMKSESIGAYSYDRFDGRWNANTKAVLNSYRIPV